MNVYKLFRVRRDGSLGSLFINRSQRLDVGVWYPAADHPTAGYAHRPGWHCCLRPHAPHLSMRDRVWALCEATDYEQINRPVHQGGVWILAQNIRIVNILSIEDVDRIRANDQ